MPPKLSGVRDATAASAPEIGAPMLYIRPPYLDLIFGGLKTFLVKERNYTPAYKYVCYDKFVHGKAHFGKGVLIKTDAEWRRLIPQHHWVCPRKPYPKTYALPVTEATRFAAPVPCLGLRGPTSKFYPADNQALAASVRKRTAAAMAMGAEEVGAQQVAQQTVGSAVQCPPGEAEDGSGDSSGTPTMKAAAESGTGDAAGGASSNEGVTRGSEGHAVGEATAVVNTQHGLEVYAESLKAGLARGHGVKALRAMLLEEHRVKVSMDLLNEWIAVEKATQAGAQVIKSQQGLNVYAESLRAGLARGYGAKALRRVLLDEHLVSVSIDLMKRWMGVERAKQADALVMNSREGLNAYAESFKAGLARDDGANGTAPGAASTGGPAVVGSFRQRQAGKQQFDVLEQNGPTTQLFKEKDTGAGEQWRQRTQRRLSQGACGSGAGSR